MECLICPLKESMICSIFPCAISVLFTDWDKNQEGFICQKQKFKAERGIQSPESQLEPTHAISPQDRASQRPAGTGLRGTQRADRDDGPRQPPNRSTVYTKIKVFVQASRLLEDLPYNATKDAQQLRCEPACPPYSVMTAWLENSDCFTGAAWLSPNGSSQNPSPLKGGKGK